MGKNELDVIVTTNMAHVEPPEVLVPYIKFVEGYQLIHGKRPTQTQVIQEIGGSFTTVAKAYRWLDEVDRQQEFEALAYQRMPEKLKKFIDQKIEQTIQSVATHIWQSCEAHAEQRVTELKGELERLHDEFESEQAQWANNIRHLESKLIQTEDCLQTAELERNERSKEAESLTKQVKKLELSLQKARALAQAREEVLSQISSVRYQDPNSDPKKSAK